MGMVHAHQQGKLPNASPAVRRAAKSMSKTDALHFAATKHKGLPKHASYSELTVAALITLDALSD